MKNFGFAGEDRVIYIGTNGKMSEVSAAMGLTGLESLEHFIEINRNNYHCYRECLSGLSGITLLPYDNSERSNFQYIIVEGDEATTGVSRDLLQQILKSENVLARRYFYPGCHRMEPYSSYFPHAGLLLPHTEKASDRVLALPTGTSIDRHDIEIISHIISIAIEDSTQLTERMKEIEES
jgi:dTDP-4-amino-4,6-dideoxygalactose transaminase